MSAKNKNAKCNVAMDAMKIDWKRDLEFGIMYERKRESCTRSTHGPKIQLPGHLISATIRRRLSPSPLQILAHSLRTPTFLW